MTEGTKGGDVNRPGSRPEIDKLPRARCVRCGLRAAAGIVWHTPEHGWVCKNRKACFRRVARAARAKETPR